MKLSNPPSFRSIRALIASQSTFYKIKRWNHYFYFLTFLLLFVVIFMICLMKCENEKNTCNSFNVIVYKECKSPFRDIASLHQYLHHCLYTGIIWPQQMVKVTSISTEEFLLGYRYSFISCQSSVSVRRVFF